MDNYDSRGDLPINYDRRRWCVCLMTCQNPSETGTSMIHQSVHAVALSSFLLSVVTALGHSLDVTVPCHLSPVTFTLSLSVPGCDRSAKSV